MKKIIIKIIGLATGIALMLIIFPVKSTYETKTYPDGVYTGYFIKGKRDGPGIFKWDNGDNYDGKWADDKRSGHGIFSNKEGVYVGNWEDDKINGFGEKVWNNGEKYIGNWVDGKRDGAGTFTDIEGNVREGNWSNDRWVVNIR